MRIVELPKRLVVPLTSGSNRDIVLKASHASNTRYSVGACFATTKSCAQIYTQAIVPWKESSFHMITEIIKRDGRHAAFERDKIANAIFQAAQASG